MEVDGVSCGWLDSHLQVGEVGLPPVEVVVEVEDQGAKAPTASEIVEGFNMVGVQLKVTSRLVPRHLSFQVSWQGSLL